MSFFELNNFDEDFFNSPIFEFNRDQTSFCSIFNHTGNTPASANEYNNQSLNSLFPIKEELNEEIYNQNKPKISLEEEEEKQEEDLNLNKVSQIEKDKDFYNQKITKEKNHNQKKLVSSTNPTSVKKETTTIKIKNKFNVENKTLPSYWRFDMVKKHWKSKISDYANNEINYYIRTSDLPEELKQIIHKPNSKLFTSNVTVSANTKFLGNTVREIFTLGKEKDKLQQQNDENINKIYDYFGKAGNLSDNIRRIKDFFEMSYEELIKKFYDSYEFNNFRDDIKTKFYDDGTKEQEGFSLLENYGLIKLFKMINKKRGRK